MQWGGGGIKERTQKKRTRKRSPEKAKYSTISKAYVNASAFLFVRFSNFKQTKHVYVQVMKSQLFLSLKNRKESRLSVAS